MADLKELAEILYGKKFWYMDPIRDVVGLTEEKMFRVPDEVSLPIIWQVGHIAHRELLHLGVMIQGHDHSIFPDGYSVFDHRWRSVDEIGSQLDTLNRFSNGLKM